jgi:hypothetical protein
LVFLGLVVGGYLGPSYLFFRSQHYTAEYKNIDEITELKDSDEVMVINIAGDARAYPNIWITQPHIAGDTIGGKEVVMTYCGLSHLGQAYLNEHKGKKLDLKVMTQLENNLVMYDAKTQKPIPQILGKPLNDKEKFKEVPSTVMSYGSYKKLYPKGKVFYNPTKLYDQPIFQMMTGALYGKGGQYDLRNDKPEFPTIKYRDKRLPSKKQVYGLISDDKAYTFTKEFIKNNNNQIQLTSKEGTITLVYFPEFDFVDAFLNLSGKVHPNGSLDSGKYAQRYPMFSKVLWVVWSHFYPKPLVNQLSSNQ